MKSSWETKRLRDLPLIFVDGDRSSRYPKRSEFVSQGILFLNAESIKDGFVNLEAANYISPEKFSTIKKGRLQKGDVLLTMRGNGVGQVAFFAGIPSTGIINAQMLILRFECDALNSRFFYYLLFAPFYFARLRSLATGSAQPQLSITNLRELEISIPEAEDQNKIAAILSVYDDLIENNLSRIKILEEIAQTLYREWFVNFRFPGHQRVKMLNSPLGKIPEGWTVGNIGDLVKERKDRNRGANSTPVLTVKNTKKFVHSEEYFSKRVYSKSLKNYKEVRRGDFAYNPSRINIGSIAFQEDYEIGVVSPMYVVFSAKVELVGGHFLWMLLQQEEIYRQIVQLCSGTVRQIFKFKDFSLVKTVIPSKKVQSMFEEIVAPIQSQTKTLAVIVENLRRTRDLLLPKLISGELDVSELDITISEANA